MSIAVRECTGEELPRLRGLWEGLYDHQRAHGQMTRLSDDGFDRWAAGLAPTLGRFSCVFVASGDGGEPIGFLAGRVRTPTPPFEPIPSGFISEVFVDERHRGAGVGRALIEAAVAWFAEQEVERLELQVLVENADARASYQRLGWRDELVQMIYTIPRPR